MKWRWRWRWWGGGGGGRDTMRDDIKKEEED